MKEEDKTDKEAGGGGGATRGRRVRARDRPALSSGFSHASFSPGLEEGSRRCGEDCPCGSAPSRPESTRAPDDSVEGFRKEEEVMVEEDGKVGTLCESILSSSSLARLLLLLPGAVDAGAAPACCCCIRCCMDDDENISPLFPVLLDCVLGSVEEDFCSNNVALDEAEAKRVLCCHDGLVGVSGPSSSPPSK